jgi:S-methylmethionine-dependent homocysteine/selenocysteine methylase
MTEITILDGGMGQELMRRSGAKPTRLWSAQVMFDMPDLVRDVHIDFIRAGAQIVTLNSYSCTPERLAPFGMLDQFEPLQNKAYELARQAADTVGVPVKLAGCLPPLIQSYQPNLVPADSVLRDTWQRIVDIQAKRVDLIIAETLTTEREGRIAAQVISEAGLPAWIAFSTDDRDGKKLRSDEPLAGAVSSATEAGAQALLINCSWPEAVPQALPVLAMSEKPTGAYANGFTGISAMTPTGTVDLLRARDDIGPDAYAEHAIQWAKAGASIVGGCCEIGPAHISALRDRLMNAKAA